VGVGAAEGAGVPYATVVAGVGGALTRGVAGRCGTLWTMPLTRGVPGTRGVLGRPDRTTKEGVGGTANPPAAPGEAPKVGVGGAPVLSAFRASFCEGEKIDR
jgi:hypothetical protein